MPGKVYDESGHLLGEYDGSGNLIEETVWMGDVPVATLQPNGTGVSVYYIHTDHLNTPRRISRPADNVIVWRWDSEPFGTAAANQDPDGDGTQFVYNPRFPGQYYDAETGLNYNAYRDYDPAVGRYIESDPIGLHGGVNTYAYVGGNPVMWTDPLGLCKCTLKPGAFSNNPLKQNFITAANVSAANNVANQLDVTTADILAIAALESGWGTSNFAVQGNNFFGLHAPQAGQSGTVTGTQGVAMAAFSGFAASAQAFANNYGGLVQGDADRAAFFSALQQSGKFGIDPPTGKPVPSYVPSGAATAREIAAGLICTP
jgi:RHS repeat-associated protein